MNRVFAIVVGTAWYFSWASFLLLPPIPGSIVLIGIAGAFAWRYLLPASAFARASGTTDLWEQSTWLALAVTAYLVCELCLGVLYARVAGLPAVEAGGRFATYARRPLGWLPMTTLAVVVGPLMEEWLFRGILLDALRRRSGVVAATLVSAVLFAAAHLDRWAFPMHLLFGIAAGALAVVSESLWPSIALHAIANAAAPIITRLMTAASAVLVTSSPHSPLIVLASVGALSAGGIFVATVLHARRLRLGPSLVLPANGAALSSVSYSRPPVAQ